MSAISPVFNTTLSELPFLHSDFERGETTLHNADLLGEDLSLGRQ